MGEATLTGYDMQAYHVSDSVLLVYVYVYLMHS